MSNPVQDFVNKTTLLNNILSNKRATDLSQKAQTKGTSTNRNSPRPPSAAGLDTTQFKQTGTALLPKLLAERSGGTADKQREAELFFNSLLEIYRQTAQKDGFPANDLAYAFEYFVCFKQEGPLRTFCSKTALIHFGPSLAHGPPRVTPSQRTISS